MRGVREHGELAVRDVLIDLDGVLVDDRIVIARQYQGGCRDGFERLASMFGSSSIMPVTLSSRWPRGVSRFAAGTAAIDGRIRSRTSGRTALSLGLRLAAIATIFFTFAGCRMPRRSASMPPSLHPSTSTGPVFSGPTAQPGRRSSSPPVWGIMNTAARPTWSVGTR